MHHTDKDIGSYRDLRHAGRRVTHIPGPYNELMTQFLTNVSAIAVSIGENLLVSKLIGEVPKYTSTISPQTVIEAGALNLTTLTASPAVLTGLRKAYSTAISATMICATVTICVSILATFGMRRLNLKEESRDREVSKQAFQLNASEKEHQVQETESVTGQEKVS